MRQAHRIIEENRELLLEAKRTHGYTSADYKRWLEEEKAYLLTVGKEPEEDKLMFEYIRARDEWHKAE